MHESDSKCGEIIEVGRPSLLVLMVADSSQVVGLVEETSVTIVRRAAFMEESFWGCDEGVEVVELWRRRGRGCGSEK